MVVVLTLPSCDWPLEVNVIKVFAIHCDGVVLQFHKVGEVVILFADYDDPLLALYMVHMSA